MAMFSESTPIYLTDSSCRAEPFLSIWWQKLHTPLLCHTYSPTISKTHITSWKESSRFWFSRGCVRSLQRDYCLPAECWQDTDVFTQAVAALERIHFQQGWLRLSPEMCILHISSHRPEMVSNGIDPSIFEIRDGHVITFSFKKVFFC